MSMRCLSLSSLTCPDTDALSLTIARAVPQSGWSTTSGVGCRLFSRVSFAPHGRILPDGVHRRVPFAIPLGGMLQRLVSVYNDPLVLAGT